MSVSFYQFLSDDYQHQLKNQARNTTTRFHSALFEYRKLFWDNFDKTCSPDVCGVLSPKLNSVTGDKKIIYNWINDLQAFIMSNKKEFDDFFQALISVYDTYINGDITKASTDLHKILLYNNLFDLASDVNSNYPVFYRGRIKSTKITNLQDFYHVPYDELHKAKSYRFSVIGQPMIYCGASLPTVSLELGDVDFNNPDLQYSLWAPMNGTNLALYDISNYLHDLLSWNFIAFTSSGVEITFDNESFRPSKKTAQVDFKKFILSQLCTFLRKDFSSQNFVEEYVFPQLVTDQIRNYTAIRYDGFIFPSTKYASMDIKFSSNFDYTNFKNNVAFFCPYSFTDKFSPIISQKFIVRQINNGAMIDKSSYDKLINDFKTKNGPTPQNPYASHKIIIGIKQALLSDYYDQVILQGNKFVDINLVKVQFNAIMEYLNSI